MNGSPRTTPTSRRMSALVLLFIAALALALGLSAHDAQAYGTSKVVVLAGPPVNAWGAGATVIIYGGYSKYFSQTAQQRWFTLPSVPKTISPVSPAFWGYSAVFTGVPNGPTRIRVIYAWGREQNIYVNIGQGWSVPWWLFNTYSGYYFYSVPA